MNILLLLRQKKYIAISAVTGLMLMSVNYYLMANLPGERNYQCVIGAGLTLGNILFAVVQSVLTGLMAAGIGYLFLQASRTKKTVPATVAGIGTLLGTLTTFCTLCTLPVISLFGASLGLGFISNYNLPFKLASLALLAIGLYLLNKTLGRNLACIVPRNLKKYQSRLRKQG